VLEAGGAAGIAGLLAFGELISRYRNHQGAPWRCRWVWIYLLVNGGAGFVAYFTLQAFGWRPTSSSQGAHVAQIVTAGVSAVAILRAATFASPHGHTSTGRRFDSLLAAFLTKADSQVNDAFDEYLTAEAVALMKGISYQAASEILPRYCIQSRSFDDEASVLHLGKQVGAIAALELPDEASAILLGRELVRFTGKRAARRSVQVNRSALS